MAENFWEKIPMGKDDKPVLLVDPTAKLIYDINDADGSFYMLDRAFEGCVTFPFTKPMQGGGDVTLNEKCIPFTLKELSFGGMQLWWLGVKLRGGLCEYGQQGVIRVSGFSDIYGNVMEPVTLTVEAIGKTKPNPKDIVHEKIALNAAEEGIVLLKNEAGTLPLLADEILNVFGKGMYEFRFSAVGAGRINPRYAVGFLEAIRHSKFQLNEELTEFYACGEDKIPDSALVEQAKQKSNKAIMLISRAAGENLDVSSDKGEFYLSEEEKTLLGYLREQFERVVLILNVGHSLDAEFSDYADAVLYSGFGGMLGGQAIVNVLNGTVNPSGKLPDTWAKTYFDYPSSSNFYDCAGGKKRFGANDGDIWIDTVYEEDIYVGYRYFETFRKEVAFPFGFGLSYTTFSVKGGRLTYDGKFMCLTAQVINMGERAGKETVQIYIKKPTGVLEKPARELVDFEKTRLLAPKEMQTFSFSVGNECLASYDEKSACYLMERGEYVVYVGTDVKTAYKIGSFRLTSDKVVKQVVNRMQPNMDFTRLTRTGAKFPKGKLSGVKTSTGLSPKAERKRYPVKFTATSATGLSFDEITSDDTLKAFVASLTTKELARLAVCNNSGWGMEGKGEAGRLVSLDGKHLPEFIVADGNSGVNLKQPNIGMPSGVTLCASFNKQLIESVGRTIGEEARALGIHLILAPAFNIHRNPLCGRQPEYFSEDPYLAGKMAGSYCRGLESTGVGGCYKHLICNNAESSRKRNQSIVSERAIREIYFAAFRYAFEEHQPCSIMTAYNAVNGVFTAEDSDLLQGLVREECGFEGFVMTDWESYDTADICAMQNAGNTWMTPGSGDDKFTSVIEQGIAEGKISIDRLRENIYYLLNTVLKLTMSK